MTPSFFPNHSLARGLVKFLSREGFTITRLGEFFEIQLPRVPGYIIRNLTPHEVLDFAVNHCYPGYSGRRVKRQPNIVPLQFEVESQLKKAEFPSYTIVNDDYRNVQIPEDAMIVSDPPFGIGYKYDKHDDKMTPNEWLDLMEGIRGRPSVLVLPWQQAYLLASRWGTPADQAVWTFRSGYRGHQHRVVMWYGCKPDMTRPEIGQPFVDSNSRWAVKARKQGRFLARRSYHWHVEQVMSKNKDRTPHPCQMPEEVIRLMILSTAKPGQPIFEPFLGSGTAGVVAVKYGFPFIGCDVSESYCKIALNRIGGVSHEYSGINVDLSPSNPINSRVSA